MANPTISAFIKNADGTSTATTSGSTTSTQIVIPVAAIGLDYNEATDLGEFLNALLRTVCANYDAAATKPSHVTPSKSTYVKPNDEAERSYSLRLDIQFGSESVIDEASA